METGLVVLWGTLVGLDLVTGPQVMIARPLVAGTVAGAILGDPVAGVTVGMLLELFALEVVPVGGSRYADYGPAAVAAAWVAVDAPLGLALGPAALVGLVVARAGEESMQFIRRRNDSRVQANRSALDRGDAGTLVRLQLIGIGADAVRAAALTLLGLGLAALARDVIPWSARSAAVLGMLLVAIGAGTASAAALRVAGHGAAARWLIAGAALGFVVAGFV